MCSSYFMTLFSNEERIRKKRPVEIFGKDLDFYQGYAADCAPNSHNLLPGNGKHYNILLT